MHLIDIFCHISTAEVALKVLTPKFSPLLSVTLVLAYGSPVSRVATTTVKQRNIYAHHQTSMPILMSDT